MRISLGEVGHKRRWKGLVIKPAPILQIKLGRDIWEKGYREWSMWLAYKNKFWQFAIKHKLSVKPRFRYISNTKGHAKGLTLYL